MVGRIYRNGTSNSNNWQQCRLSNNMQYLDAIVLKTGGVFCAGLWIKWTRIPWYFYPSSYSVTNVTEYRKGADDPVSYRYCRKPETVETRSLLCVLVSTLCDFPECTEYTNSRQVQQKWRVARRQRRGAEKYNEHSVKRSWNAVKVSKVKKALHTPLLLHSTCSPNVASSNIYPLRRFTHCVWLPLKTPISPGNPPKAARELCRRW